MAYDLSGMAEAAMGLVINPRGTSGAGKTWLVHEVMAAYHRAGAVAVPVHSGGRSRPMGWRLGHPWGGPPLHVIGHYGATRGGTDTIPLADGGLDEAFRLAGELAADGDVLLEGLQLSGDVERTAALACLQRLRGSALHVLCLDVPVDRCIRNVMARRRAGPGAVRAITHTAEANQTSFAAACAALRRTDAITQWLDAPAALRRSLALLGASARPQTWVPAASGVAQSTGPAATPASVVA